MPIETPHGISVRVPPSSFHKGKFFCLASASHKAFSSAAFAMRWPRTLAKEMAQSRADPTSRPEHSRRKIMRNGGPTAFDPLAAVERIFAGHAFPPAIDSLAMHGDQQNAAAVGASETRLKKMDERHVNLAQRDGFNFHSSVSSTEYPVRVTKCRDALVIEVLQVLVLLADLILPTRTTNSHPSYPARTCRCLPRRARSLAQRILAEGRKKFFAVAFLDFLAPCRGFRARPSTHKSAPELQSLPFLTERWILSRCQ